MILGTLCILVAALTALWPEVKLLSQIAVLWTIGKLNGRRIRF